MLRDAHGPDATVYAAPAPAGFLPLLRLSFAAHGIFLAIAGGFFLLLHSLLFLVPGMSSRSASDVLLAIVISALPMHLIALVTYQFIEMVVYERPKSPTLRLFSKVFSVLFDRKSLAKGLPMYVSLFCFIYVFGLMKANITVFQPFRWDETFDRWDVVIHFGRRPWEWLQPLLGHPHITFLVNLNYNLWFFVMMGFWVHYAFVARPGVERTRYYMSFMLIWMIGGTFFAILFSSAGPCFYGEGRLGLSPDPYADLMAYLRSAAEVVPVWALTTQDILWSHREQASAFGGVSAMPSMHNATVLLFLLTSRGWARWVRLVLLAHFVLVFLGSVHLAWHYAVDAYLAWAIVLAVWWATGPLARWWESRPATLAFPRAIEAP